MCLNRRLIRIENKLDHLAHRLECLMATLDDVESEVTETSGVVDSAILLLQTLHDELVAALEGDDPERIQAIVDTLSTKTDALAAAVAANPAPDSTTPTPEPTPEPEPEPTPEG